MDRQSRPDPKRTKPNRSAIHNPGDFGTEGSGTARPPEDVISQAVLLGYQVIEKQILQGRSAAERIRAGVYSSGDAEQDINSLIGRVVSLAKEMGVAWFDLLSTTMPMRDPKRYPVGSGYNITVKSRSQRSVQVDCKLTPPSPRFVPCIRGLHAADAKLPALTDVRFMLGSEGGLAVVIDLPDGQPAGTYTGAIVDMETNLPGGTLSVLIQEDTGEDASRTT